MTDTSTVEAPSTATSTHENSASQQARRWLHDFEAALGRGDIDASVALFDSGSGQRQTASPADGAWSPIGASGPGHDR